MGLARTGTNRPHHEKRNAETKMNENVHVIAHPGRFQVVGGIPPARSRKSKENTKGSISKGSLDGGSR